MMGSVCVAYEENFNFIYQITTNLTKYPNQSDWDQEKLHLNLHNGHSPNGKNNKAQFGLINKTKVNVRREPNKSVCYHDNLVPVWGS